jgi:hypothetical protein
LQRRHVCNYLHTNTISCRSIAVKKFTLQISVLHFEPPSNQNLHTAAMLWVGILQTRGLIKAAYFSQIHYHCSSEGTKVTIPSFLSHLTSSYVHLAAINLLNPSVPYIGRTAPLTYRRCILYIYSTNIGTEHFKHAAHSLFFLFKMSFVS